MLNVTWHFDIHSASSSAHTLRKQKFMLEDCIEGGECKLYILEAGNLSGLKGFDSYLLIKDMPTVVFIPISQEM